MNTISKNYFLLVVFMLFGLVGFSQDIDKVYVQPQANQSATELQDEKNECLASADQQFDHSKHKTLKNTGAGAGAGAIVGKIFGSGGAGAVVGGAAGAFRGRKMSNKDEREFNNTYASCLRDKGYSVTVED